jgi:hypothetical protein
MNAEEESFESAPDSETPTTKVHSRRVLALAKHVDGSNALSPRRRRRGTVDMSTDDRGRAGIARTRSLENIVTDKQPQSQQQQQQQQHSSALAMSANNNTVSDRQSSEATGEQTSQNSHGRRRHKDSGEHHRNAVNDDDDASSLSDDPAPASQQHAPPLSPSKGARKLSSSSATAPLAAPNGANGTALDSTPPRPRGVAPASPRRMSGAQHRSNPSRVRSGSLLLWTMFCAIFSDFVPNVQTTLRNVRSSTVAEEAAAVARRH